MEEVAVRTVDNRKKFASPISLTADELCQTYAARVYKFAQLISSDAGNAEDLAQDALERAIRGLKTFNPVKGEIEGWLWRIVVNASRDAGRIAGRQRLVFELLADRWPVDEKAIHAWRNRARPRTPGQGRGFDRIPALTSPPIRTNGSNYKSPLQEAV
jgi:DNA-directed RNA polymerase specialized sigma24 family protein